MKGSVLWESNAQRETWEGAVARCVRRGRDINVVFHCADLGEGQLTVTDVPGEHLATGRFRYYRQKEAAQVSVRGSLSYRPGILVFDGVWTDPIDGTGQWEFLLEVEGLEGRLSADVPSNAGDLRESAPLTHLVAKFTPEFVTEKHDFRVEPAHQGIYRVWETVVDSQGPSGYAWWDWAGWSEPRSTIEALLEQRTNCEQPNIHFGWVQFWQGLNKAGWRATRPQP